MHIHSATNLSICTQIVRLCRLIARAKAELRVALEHARQNPKKIKLKNHKLKKKKKKSNYKNKINTCIKLSHHQKKKTFKIRKKGAEEQDANPPGLNRQNSTHTVVQINTKLPNISTLDKKLVILTHGNFTEWHACIQDIAYFRNWADCVLNVPWDGREEANQAINQQRRDAYWVLKNSIPLRTDYHHLATGLKRGDAHALYTKIHKLFLKATAKNRGKIRKEFYNLSMASTKLNVTKFAAKVVQLAEDLEAVGGKLDQDEVVTRFLSGLSKKFD